jgi:hypothetical protein
VRCLSQCSGNALHSPRVGVNRPFVSSCSCLLLLRLPHGGTHRCSKEETHFRYNSLSVCLCGSTPHLTRHFNVDPRIEACWSNATCLAGFVKPGLYVWCFQLHSERKRTQPELRCVAGLRYSGLWQLSVPTCTQWYQVKVKVTLLHAMKTKGE